MKLTTRILILAGATLVPGILAGAYTELALRKERAEEVNQLAMRNTRQAAAYIDQVLQSIRGVLTTAAAADAVSDPDRCHTFLASLKDSLEYIGGLGVIDANGVLRCASGSNSAVDLNDRGYFVEAQRRKTFYVGEYVRGKVSQRPLLMTAQPLPGSGDRPEVIFAGLDLGWLQRRLEGSDMPKGANVTVADRNGTIIARNPQPERFVGTSIPAPFMNIVHAKEAGVIDVKSQDGTTRILAYLPVDLQPLGLYVSSGLSKDDAFRLIDRATAFAIGVSLASAAFALILAVILGRFFIATPVASILSTIERWRRGSVDARTGARTNGEIGLIGWSLDRLLDELHERDRQRELLSREIAHRVKNTLAIVQAIASQTLRRGPAGLSSFSSRLNALGRAYDVLLAGNWHHSTIAQVVESATAAHQRAEVQRISFSGDDTVLDARAVLALTLVLHELCTNAIKYGALSVDGGTVSIVSIVTGKHVVLTWMERGGPVVAQSRAEGFGTTLIQNAFPREFEAKIQVEYPADGVRCTIFFNNKVSKES